MRAIECALDRFAKRNLTGVGDDHRSPGDGLQSQPLQTHRRTEREYRDRFAGKSQHPPRLPSELAVRQITETGRADLSDCKISLPNELKLIHQR